MTYDKPPTIIDVTHYHMPTDHLIGCRAERIEVGQTVRQALKSARAINWGNMGTASAELSDGTTLDVELHRCRDGSRLLDSQQAVRRDPFLIMCRYNIR